MAIDIFHYLYVTLFSFIVNVIPAFVPPTWTILSLYKINNPAISTLALAFFGVLGSIAGRYVMYRYSHFFGRYVPKKDAENLSYFRKLVGDKGFGLFFGTFLYSLSPLPSNFLFIAFGLSGVNIPLVLLGFALGRFLSYSLLIGASFSSFSILSGILGIKHLKYIVDVLGVIFAISIIFIKWKKVYAVINRLKKNLARLVPSSLKNAEEGFSKRIN